MGLFRTILFDFDYTLADSSRGAVECINWALQRVGLPTASDEDICRTIGMSLADALMRLAGPEQASKTQDFARFFAERADQVMAERTVLFESVLPATSVLKQRGLRLGIVSTKYRCRIEGVLRRDGLREVFDLIVGGEDVARHKPDPEGLLVAIDRLDSAASQTLYVGDSLVDAETARRAGTPFVAVLSGTTRLDEFTPSDLTGVIESLHQLPSWLQLR